MNLKLIRSDLVYRELLQDSAIFGVELYAVGLGEKVEGYLREMLAGNGAVRATLKKHLA